MKTSYGQKAFPAALILSLLLALIMVNGSDAQFAGAQAGSQTFPETGKTVSGDFLTYWKSHGGLAQQGYPISAEIQEKSQTDGKTYTVQYFERSVFENHPENPAASKTLLSLLGNFSYAKKYPSGAPDQTPNTSAGSVLFSETGKHLGGDFLAYWKANGGLAQQGYPISEEFKEKSDLDGKTYTVQYFERAVFEMHPENPAPYKVLLSQLGTFRYKEQYAGTNPEPPASTEVQVMIKDFNFVPSDITVAVGTKVTWTNTDQSEHTVADLGHTLYNSGYLYTGKSFSYT
ncbi:MAG: hypothetical protein ABIQ44_15820, partial [Chloroflexia bacterium]